MFLRKFMCFAFVLLLLSLNSSVYGGEKHALLIGIDDYSLSDGIANLNGAINDVKIMRKVLEDKRFGFDKIEVLINSQATHSNIERAFKRLINSTKKEQLSSVYIYYSGHGSQTKDLNGDEAKIMNFQGNFFPSFDQTWISYGSRLKKGASPPEGFAAIDQYDVLDDEIAAWLGEIAENCGQVIFVSDSCHSGSVSREGIASGVRRGAVDMRPHPRGKNEYPLKFPKNLISISASKDSQMAREFIPIGSAKAYGIFSWYWTKALKACIPTDSWRHVFNRVARIVYQETPNRQVPQIAGAASMKMFESDFLPPPKTISVYEVLKVEDGFRVYLEAGGLSGVTQGSIYTLEDRRGQPDAPEIIIEEVHPTHSIAKTTNEIEIYRQLIEVRHHHTFPATRLFLKIAHEKDCGEKVKKIKAIIESLEAYEISTDEEGCDLILYLFRPENSLFSESTPQSDAEPNIKPPRSNKNGDPQIWVLDKNGVLYQRSLRHAFSEKGLAAFAENLSILARVKDIVRVESSEKNSPLQISVTPMVPASQTEKITLDRVPNPSPCKICPMASYKKLDPLPLSAFLERRWDLCTIIRFNAQNPTLDTYYFYVVYIGNQGEIVPVFPSIEDRSEIAEVIPGAASARGAASIRLDSKTVDRYKLIVCKKPINHLLFFQPGVKAGIRGPGKFEEINPLERLLLNALSGKRNYVSCQTGSWYAETITIDMCN